MENKIQPMTVNLLSVVDKEGMVKIIKNKDRGPMPHLDKVLEDLKLLAKNNHIKLFESISDSCEIIITNNLQKFDKSFII
jgi:hypothetical protein